MATTFLQVGILLGGIYLLIWSGTKVVRSLTRISRFFGLSEFIVSFVLMAFATTLPEFGVGISAAISGNPTIALGNVIGTNIVNLSFILGLIVIISGGIVMHRQEKKFFLASRWFDVVMITLPLVMLLDGTLSRWEGGILLAFFVGHIIRLLRSQEIFSLHHHFGAQQQKSSSEGAISLADNVIKDIALFGVFVLVLLGSSYAVVSSSRVLAEALRVPEILFGLFVVAIGTSLPELVFGIRAAFLHMSQASLGNLLGAAVLNSTWVLGATALIHPIVIQSYGSFLVGATFLLFVLFLAVHFMRTGGKVSVKEGVALVSLYLLFLVGEMLLG